MIRYVAADLDLLCFIIIIRPPVLVTTRKSRITTSQFFQYFSSLIPILPCYAVVLICPQCNVFSLFVLPRDRRRS